METRTSSEGEMLDRGSGAKSIGRLRRALCATVALLALGLLASTAAVAAPPSLTIASPSAGGWSASPTPAIAGASSDSADVVVVRVYEGASAAGTLVQTLETTPTSGTWSVPTQALADGQYTVVAQQLDSETLETGTSEEVAFTVDTVPPGVSLSPFTTPTDDSTPTFEGSLGGALGDEPAVSVAVYEGESTAGSPVESGPAAVSGGSWSYASAPLGDGTYTVIATQRDAAGNVGVAGPAKLVIDTTPPAVSLDTGSIAALGNNPTPTFTGTGGELPGDAPTVKVLVHRGSSVTGTIAVEGSASVIGGAWSFTTTHLPDGTYTVQALQRDQAGNEGHSATATFRVDTTPPTLTITSPKAHETLKSSSRPTFSGATSNGAGEPTAVSIEIFDGESTAEANLAQSLSVERSGSSWTTGSTGPRLANGTYTVRARELDAAGNLGESTPLTFTVGVPSPAVTLDALARWTNDATPSLAGTAATFEAKPNVTVKIWDGASASGTLAETITTPVLSGGWSLSATTPLPDGTYTAQAEQEPEASNPAGVSDTSTFTVDTVAPVPTLSLAAPDANESGVDEIVAGAAGAAPGDRRQVTVELFSGASAEPGSEVETITVNAVAGAWSARLAGLAPGEYTVQARQSDEAGNVGTSAAGSFTVAAPASSPQPATQAPVSSGSPSPPVASFTWAPTNPTVGQVVSLASSSTDLSSSIGSYAWDLGGGQLAPGGATATTSFATPGPHVVRLQVTDGNGLSSTVAQTITVAAAPPQLMQPFPIVRIAGSETSYGVYVKLLTVQAPVGASVQVACVGRACKTKAETRIAVAAGPPKVTAGAVTLTFKRFERALRAGVTLQIRVTKPGLIGKFTSFAIRRGKLPVRADACLAAPSAKPSPCPSS